MLQGSDCGNEPLSLGPLHMLSVGVTSGKMKIHKCLKATNNLILLDF